MKFDRLALGDHFEGTMSQIASDNGSMVANICSRVSTIVIA